MNRRCRRALRPVVDRLNDRSLLSGLTPSQVTHAYGLDSISFDLGGTTVRGDGGGQTIAIIDSYHDPYVGTDLHTFDLAYNLPDPSLTQINRAGHRTNLGWAEEETLDVEWAHAIAPGAAIVVVEARSPSVHDLMVAVDIARSLPGVSVVSMSWGGGEFVSQTVSDRHFRTPNGHTGITFVASSGDEGVRGGAEWPPSAPGVLGVGGTTLQVSSTGLYQGETTWTGSSGGVSQIESEPGYQRGVQWTGLRDTPDVAFDANPSTGVSTYTTTPSNGSGQWLISGGTSVGAPAWAGIIAIADQGRALAGSGTLDGPSQTLPLLYGLPSSDFHNVTPAGHAFQGSTTGLGSPVGVPLIDGLAFGVVPTDFPSAGNWADLGGVLDRPTPSVVEATDLRRSHHTA
jgi:subtilase family serine protease